MLNYKNCLKRCYSNVINNNLNMVFIETYNSINAKKITCNVLNEFAFKPVAFSKLVDVGKPPKAGAFFRKELNYETQFRKFYNRGDFPIALEHDTKGNKIAWKVEIEKLDYHHYLPLFFEGLAESEHPYDFFARQG